MKKLIVVLLALVVASSVFAQLTINGYNRTLVTIDKDASATIANRLRMNLSFKDADGNFGAGGRLQSDAFGTPAVKYANGWAYLFDKKVKITAGKFANYDYNIGSGVSDFQLGNLASDLYMWDVTTGLMVKVNPVEGLNASVAYMPDAKLDGADFTAGASYDIKDVGTVKVAAKFSSDIFFSGAFTYTGVEGLSASAGFMYGGNAGYVGYVAKQMTAFAAANYSKDAIAVEVVPVFDITNSKFYVEGYVGYTLDALTANVLYMYDTGTGLNGSDYFFGVEANYAVGKATLMTGVWYDEAAKLSIPLMLKVGF